MPNISTRPRIYTYREKWELGMFPPCYEYASLGDVCWKSKLSEPKCIQCMKVNQFNPRPDAVLQMPGVNVSYTKDL